MSDTVISVEGLSKRYALGAAEKATSFRDAVSGVLTAPFKRFGRMADGGGTEDFWALKDVNFEVKRGEVVGVIGRNGAGKSTLLKVLSRITPPTSGHIKLRGRVASLLEVGTGFHPELTGRENIFLNGTILGMQQSEIKRKFDEIVAFSEVEKFLDTPVKRYSSGMYVRLAFAVAAHLEPEILIVDEVLAVGDAQFQKKCLGKMKEVSEGGGRTVLFVSHNMAAVRSLCTSIVVLRSGTIDFAGEVAVGVNRYDHPKQDASGDNRPLVSLPEAEVVHCDVRSVHGMVATTKEDCDILVGVRGRENVRVGVEIFIKDRNGTLLFRLDSKDFFTPIIIEKGELRVVTFGIKSLPLHPGEFFIEIRLQNELTWKSADSARPQVLNVLGNVGYGMANPDHLSNGILALRASVVA